jgi:hypothetical protein
MQFNDTHKEFIRGEIIKGKKIAQICKENNFSKNTVYKKIKLWGLVLPAKENLTGCKFGKLKVIDEKKERVGACIRRLYLCQCECGNEINCLPYDLNAGNRTSCGCNRGSHNWNGFGEISGAFWFNLKTHAEKRNHSFDIEIDYAWNLFLKQKRKCALSGVDLQFSRRFTENKLLQTASLDRIDSNYGYIKGNVQWVHKLVNIMKHKMPEREFFDFCCKIADNLRDKYAQ